MTLARKLDYGREAAKAVFAMKNSHTFYWFISGMAGQRFRGSLASLKKMVADKYNSEVEYYADIWGTTVEKNVITCWCELHFRVAGVGFVAQWISTENP